MDNKPFRKKHQRFGGKRIDFKNTSLFTQSDRSAEGSDKAHAGISVTEEDMQKIKPSEYFWKSKLPVIDDKDKLEIECPDYNDIPVYSSNDTEISENHDGKTEIVGVRFRAMGKVYYFLPYIPDANGRINSKIIHTKSGDTVIADTARGMEIGTVFVPNKFIENEKLEALQPMRSILRIATDEDITISLENKETEKKAEDIFIEKVNAHGLPMKLIDIQYTFDRTKLLFYFSSEGRVDFRELVKDLAAIFHTRIELRQIGIRDEARIMGGLGACGRPLCCSSFLTDFVQVSIKMAKSQVMSLNPSKISGCCGRLMCCLRYENDVYEEEISKTPPVDSVVKTEDGFGTVVETNPLAGMVKVKLVDNSDTHMAVYNRDCIEVIDPKDPAYLEAVEKRRNFLAVSAAKTAERQARPLNIPAPSQKLVKIAANENMFEDSKELEEKTAAEHTPEKSNEKAQKNRNNRNKRTTADNDKNTKKVQQDKTVRNTSTPEARQEQNRKIRQEQDQKARQDQGQKAHQGQDQKQRQHRSGNRMTDQTNRDKEKSKAKATDAEALKNNETKQAEAHKPAGNHRRRHYNRNAQKNVSNNSQEKSTD